MDELEFDRQDNLKRLEELLDPVLPGVRNSAETSLTIRLPASLKESLRVEAEARGLNLSDYARSKLFDEIAPIRRRPQRQVSGLDRSLLIELRRIGINLNQAVRKLNSQKQPSVNQADRQLLQTLLDVLQKVKLAFVSGINPSEEE